jgi:hypothetical protein
MAANELCWEILPHIHKSCCGRLLRRVLADGTVIVRCAACGEEAAHHGKLCWCAVGVGKTTLRCVANPNRSAEAPDEIVAIEEGAP